MMDVPFIFGASTRVMISEVVCGLLLIALSVRRGPIRHAYGGWNRWLV